METTTTTTTTDPVCILNHAPAWDTEVAFCGKPATAEWHRPGRKPIPICEAGRKPGRYIRPINLDSICAQCDSPTDGSSALCDVCTSDRDPWTGEVNY